MQAHESVSGREDKEFLYLKSSFNVCTSGFFQSSMKQYLSNAAVEVSRKEAKAFSNKVTKNEVKQKETK